MDIWHYWKYPLVIHDIRREIQLPSSLLAIDMAITKTANAMVALVPTLYTHLDKPVIHAIRGLSIQRR